MESLFLPFQNLKCIVNMRKLISTCLFLSIGIQLFSQSNTVIDNLQFQQLIGESFQDQGITNLGIYFNDNWLPGKVILNTDDYVEGIMLRYNSFEDQLIWLSKENGQIKLDKSNVKAFEIKSQDTVFRFKRIFLNPGKDTLSCFLNVCYEGRVQLFVLRKVVPNGYYYKQYNKFNTYKPDPQYYLVVDNKPYFIKRTKAKSLYAIFPELKDKIKKRVKADHLNGGKESDFINALKDLEDILTGGN
jgi:hypothetical protein